VDAGGELPVIALSEAAAQAFAVRRLTPEEATALGYGQRIEAAEPGRTDPVAAIRPDGRLVALRDETRPTARTHVVFAPAGS
jgi:tRNA pseudouridine55 synthase